MSAAPSITSCPECGAELSAGGTCREYFYALLALESKVPGAAGAEPHFLAVATYNLQHPGGFVPSALVGLYDTLTDILAGRATVADALRRARHATDGAVRVHRRPGTPLSADEHRLLGAWPTRWSMPVRDACAVSPERYVTQVRAWACSVEGALADLLAPSARVRFRG